jgi:glycosyltransferase involved in cell wall biosynthesis
VIEQPPKSTADDLRIVLVAENVSLKIGGEASRPYYCFKLMRAWGVDAWLVCHARTRAELRELLDDEDFDRIRFLKDGRWQKFVWSVGKWCPERFRERVISELIHVSTQRRARRLVQKMVAQLDIQAVYQPSPNAPKGLSFMYGLNVPVIIGPLSGGIDLPPGFRQIDSLLSRLMLAAVRCLTPLVHALVPGKRQADALIVANQRTEAALPRGCKGKTYEVIESGVDLSIWQPRQRIEPRSAGPVRFVSSGRFVGWKGFGYLIEAFAPVAAEHGATLELIGDGDLRPMLEEQVKALKLQDCVRFHGWLSRHESAAIIADCDVFVQSSLAEAGGTAIIEALALGLPIVAVDWGGPAQIVNDTCGILVKPESKEQFVKDLSAALDQLATMPEQRCAMATAAKQRARENYMDWESKVQRILEIIVETVHRRDRRGADLSTIRPARGQAPESASSCLGQRS